MRRWLFCVAVIFALGPAAALAEEPPIHDCLEGGSMDWNPIEAGTQTAEPTADS